MAPRIADEMAPADVRRIDLAGTYAVGGVAGLLLRVRAREQGPPVKQWVLRVRVGEKRRDIGLGGFPTVSLAQARERARVVRDQIASGADPVLERRQARKRLAAEQAAAAQVLTFGKAVDRYLDSKGRELLPKQLHDWGASLRTYAVPKIGDLDVAHVTLRHVHDVLEPIWLTKTALAKRVRLRMEAVLAWATVHGYRGGDNPARWRHNLDKLLPAPSKMAAEQHHRALPFKDVPGFMRRLAGREGMAAMALRFLVLTAARSGEVRGATWAEVDLEAATWVIPSTRMKTRREHRVPLCDAALAVLLPLRAVRSSDAGLVFPGARGKPLSDMSLSSVTRRMGIDAVPHGFRSSFRDWCAEVAHAPREVAEAALAHVVGGVEGAYFRADLLERRRELMATWGRYAVPDCTVTPIQRRA
jgi:integrase